MKNIIIANWKCNPVALKEAKKLFAEESKIKSKNAEVVICPPFIYLVNLKGGNLGAQNVCSEEKGSYTGEVSAAMLADLGVKYVIAGHSERRKYFAENNLDVNRKMKELLKVGLKPILCIGENRQEYDQHLKPDVLETQLTECLKDITEDQLKNIYFVYEPSWAISTNEALVCTAEECRKSVEFMRKIISELYNKEISGKINTVYGGNVQASNIKDYLENGDVNGVLVGGASLNAEEFIEIVKLSR